MFMKDHIYMIFTGNWSKERLKGSDILTAVGYTDDENPLRVPNGILLTCEFATQ